MLSSVKLGFIGAGQMARAIAFPLIQKGIMKPTQLTASSPEEEQLEPWAKHGCHVTPNNSDIMNSSDTIIWATKPQIFPNALKELQPNPSSRDAFHVSIMAGVSLSSFTNSLSSHKRPGGGSVSTARVMPNIGMRVDAGVAVYTMGPHSTAANKTVLSQILAATSLVYEVSDSQINAYCGLFSSGIGFMLVALEAMADGGVKMGIPRDKSLQLAAQTMKGAAQLVLSTDSANPTITHPAVLKDTVCSPFGTTIAGIAEMERLGVRYGLIRAIEEATLRGQVLGQLNQKVEKQS